MCVYFFFKSTFSFEYLWLKRTLPPTPRFSIPLFFYQKVPEKKLDKIVKFCRKVLIFLNLLTETRQIPKIKFLARKPISLAIWKCRLSSIKLDTSLPSMSIFSQDTPWREGFLSGYSWYLNSSSELAGSSAFLMFWQHLLEWGFFGHRLIQFCRFLRLGFLLLFGMIFCLFVCLYLVSKFNIASKLIVE